MKELYRFRQFLAESVIKEAYNLPDSDSTTDKYVNNHWDGILKDILRAHTDLRNSKGGESIPERPSQLDIDIVLGRFDGAGEFMDIDPNKYDEYFDFYDMYLVTQRDEENTKDISVEDYPEGDYSGYTKRDDLPKLDEGVIKENEYQEEEELELDADYDKGGKYYSEEGAEAFRIQPFKVNDIEYTKDQAVRQGKYIVGLEGEELKKFISDYIAAWKEDVGDTPEGKTFK